MSGEINSYVKKKKKSCTNAVKPLHPFNLNFSLLQWWAQVLTLTYTYVIYKADLLILNH